MLADTSSHSEEEAMTLTEEIKMGKYQILFEHPEAFLNSQGCSFLRSNAYQNKVAAFVIDEAHCVEIW